MRGKNYLKVTGILMIIGFGIGMISMLYLSKLVESIVGSTVLIFSIIASVVELVTGIIGVAWCKKSEKAKFCLAFGVILLVLNLVSYILQISTYGVANVIFSMILGSILPVLYIIGAVLNLKDKG